MKKILSLIAIMLGALVGYSQAPGILNYQGVARNSVGNVLVNKTINLRLTIRDGAAAGPTVYQESRVVTTNPFGLFNVQVGSPGATSVTGTIPGVNWAVGAKFIQVEIDPNGGTSFINIGTAQLASVPYSLYSNLSGDLVLPFNKTQADAGTLFKITNSNTSSAGATALEGLTNSTAGNANAIIGTVTSTAPGAFSAGVRGINNGTGGLGIGVYGSQAGSGWGVYGFTPGGIGVNGASNTGIGVNGSSASGTAGRFQTTSGLALHTSGGGVRLQNINEGVNRILATLPGDGSATWQDPSAVGIITGSGTLNYVPKWTPNGTNLGNSQIFDNGTSVGVGTATPAAANKLEVAGIQRINNTSTQEGGELRFQEGTLFGAPNHWIIDNFQSIAGGNKFRLWNDVGGMNIQMMPGGKTAIGNMVFSDQPQSTLDVEGNLTVGTAYSGTNAAPADGAIIQGNVGIGTTNPGTDKLQVLQTNAAGVGLNVNSNNAANTSNAANIAEANITSVAYGNSALRSLRGTGSLANTYLYINLPTSFTGIVAAPNGFGVQGTSETGIGVTGLSTTGTAVHGINITSGRAGLFSNNSTTNAAPVVEVNNISTVANAFGVHSFISNASPGAFSSALRGQNNGTGGLGIGVWGSQAGSGWGVYGTAPGGVGVFGVSSTGTGVFGNSSTGIAGNFENNNNANAVAAIRAFNASANINAVGVHAISGGGSGYGPLFASALIAESFSQRGILGVSNASWAVHGASNTSIGVVGESYASTGNAGVFGAGLAVNNYGVVGNAAAGTGAGGYFTGGTTALRTLGGVQLTGINEAPNRILATVPGTGQATWEDAATVGLVSGSGTLNYLPKWTPNGTTLGNSQVFDNGTAVGIGTTTPTAAVLLDMQRTSFAQLRLVDVDDASQIWMSAPSPLGGYTGGIGTFSNHDFPIFTGAAATDKMTVKVNGDVGIGTATTSGKLEVLQTGGAGAVINATNSNVANIGNGISSINVNATSGATNTTSGGGAAIFARKGSPLSTYVTNPAAIYSSTSDPSSVAVLGIGGLYSIAGVAISSGSRAVGGIANTAGSIGVLGFAVAGATALETSGAVKLTGIGEANGYVLTSDASGNATWQDPAATRVAFAVRGLTTPVSIPLFTFVPITQWSIIDYEEGSIGAYNSTTGEYTVPKTGKYHIASQMIFNVPAANGAGYSGLSVFVNGIPVKTGYNSMTTSSAVNGLHSMLDINLNAGDLVQIQLFHNTSGSVTLNNGLDRSNTWSIHLIK